jgi:hypothetical protein
VASQQAKNNTQKHTPFVVGPALLLLWIVTTATLAQEELSWWGYSVVDDSTGERSYGITKSIFPVTNGEKTSELRVGFRCHNGKPLFTFEPGRYIGSSSSDFSLHIWIDDNPRLAIDMRVWSNSSNGGFSTFVPNMGQLFSEMRAGYRLRWRIDASGWNATGSLSLIGFTAASQEFTAHCPL